MFSYLLVWISGLSILFNWTVFFPYTIINLFPLVKFDNRNIWWLETLSSLLLLSPPSPQISWLYTWIFFFPRKFRNILPSFPICLLNSWHMVIIPPFIYFTKATVKIRLRFPPGGSQETDGTLKGFHWREVNKVTTSDTVTIKSMPGSYSFIWPKEFGKRKTDTWPVKLLELAKVLAGSHTWEQVIDQKRHGAAKV